jgi:hypothetical protein
MAKKQTQPEVQLHTKFNLADISTEQRLRHAELLEHMTLTAGWQLMKQILEGNLSVIEKAILTKRDPVTGAVMTEAETDQLRMQHAQIDQLIRKPEELIKLFRAEQKVGATGSYDPYQRSTDMREERKITDARSLAT